MEDVVAYTVPAEMLCLDCARKRWGDAIDQVDFVAPEYPDETGVIFIWDEAASDRCTECHEKLMEVAGYYCPDEPEGDDL